MSVKKPRLQNNPLSWMETKKVEIQGTRLSDVQHTLPAKLRVNPLNSDFFREESDDYFAKLRDDVRARGIIVPLLAKRDGILLAGHNRLRVAIELGLETVPVQFVLDTLPENAEREFIIKDNLYRRQFSTAEWIGLYKKLYPDFDEQIQQETRGGGQKWSKTNNETNKTERSVLLGNTVESAVSTRLTAQKIASDTGQNVSAVQKQLTKYRREIEVIAPKSPSSKIHQAEQSPANKKSKGTPTATSSQVFDEAPAFFSKIEQAAHNAPSKNIRQLLKKLDGLRQKLEQMI
jgi:hypothetical protein